MSEYFDIMENFRERLSYGVHIGLLSNWYHVDVKTSNEDVMRKIHKMTTGRLMIGMRSISFEDERDAIAARLVI